MLESISQVSLITWFSFIQQELWECAQQLYFLPTIVAVSSPLVPPVSRTVGNITLSNLGLN